MHILLLKPIFFLPPLRHRSPMRFDIILMRNPLQSNGHNNATAGKFQKAVQLIRCRFSELCFHLYLRLCGDSTKVEALETDLCLCRGVRSGIKVSLHRLI